MMLSTKLSLKKMLFRQEGFNPIPYTDTTGHLTCGIGRNLSTRGISLIEAYYLLENDIDWFEDALKEKLDFYESLSEFRKAVLVDMCFNLGLVGFMTFDKMIEALRARDYESASNEMLNSTWAKQVGHRAVELASYMRSGNITIVG